MVATLIIIGFRFAKRLHLEPGAQHLVTAPRYDSELIKDWRRDQLPNTG